MIHCYATNIRFAGALPPPRSQSGTPSSNAVSASFRAVATRKLKSVGVISPFHSSTPILANKRRKLVRTPDFANYRNTQCARESGLPLA